MFLINVAEKYPTPPWVHATALVIFGILLVLVLWAILYGTHSKLMPWNSVNGYFCITFFFFICCRIVCESIRFGMSKEVIKSTAVFTRKDAYFFVQNISVMLFYGAFSFVLYGWMNYLETVKDLSQGIKAKLPKMLVACNILFDVLLLSNIIYYFTQGKNKKDNVITTVATVSCIIQLTLLCTFMVYAVKLYRSVAATFQKTLYSTLILASIFIVCVSVRLVFLFYKATTGQLLAQYADAAGHFIIWIIPDVVPMSCEFYILCHAMLVAREKVLSAQKAREKEIQEARVHSSSNAKRPKRLGPSVSNRNDSSSVPDDRSHTPSIAEEPADENSTSSTHEESRLLADQDHH